MKRWIFLTAIFAILGLPGTMFLVSTLEVSNDVHITATVQGPESDNSENSSVVSSGGGGGWGGRNSGSGSSQNDDEDDEDQNTDDVNFDETDSSEANSDEELQIEESVTEDDADEKIEEPSSPEPKKDPEALIYFGGYAFPNAVISFTLDGEPMFTVNADADGYFEGNYDSLPLGEHIFTFQAEDYEEVTTRTVSYAYNVVNESPLYISSILLPPLFEPAENGTGMNGLSIPGAEIQVFGVTQNGQELVEVETIIVNADGTYSYELDLKDGAFNQYYVSCTYKEKECGYSGIIQVQIVDGSYEIPSNVFADFTKDVAVNFVDFSFMRAAFLNKANLLFYDLDEDGALTLKDFSLLNYQWTQ